MAVATTTAIVGTAAAAKAATVAAVAGAAVSVGSATAGFISAGKEEEKLEMPLIKQNKLLQELNK